MYVNLLEANTVPGIASKLFIRPHSTQNHLKHALSCLHTLVSHTESPETCTLLSTYTCQSHRITWNMHSLVYTHLSVTQNHLKHALSCLHTLVSHTESPETCTLLSTHTYSKLHRMTWNMHALVYTHLSVTQNHLKHALSCLHTLVSHAEWPETCTLLSTHTCQSHRIAWNMHSLVYTHLSVTQNHLKHVLFCLHTLVVSHTESPKTCAFLSTYTCSQLHRITWNMYSFVSIHL